MQFTKLCKVCHRAKPYDPSAKLQSKAMGFTGKVCWDCHITNQARRLQGQPPVVYPKPEALARLEKLQEELQALNKQIERLTAPSAKFQPDVLDSLFTECQHKRQSIYTIMQSLGAPAC